MDARQYSDFMGALTILIAVMSWLFSFCTFGNSLTVRFSQLDCIIFEGPWYLLPIDMQKKLPFVMMVAQKPVYMKGFAKFQCTREVFARVFVFLNLIFIEIFDAIIK